MQKYKSLVLPIALLAGYFLREFCAEVSFLVPYVIFIILSLTMSGVKLSRLRPTVLDFQIALYQSLASIGLYYLTFYLTSDRVLSQGVMICVLCPVASSVTVVASMLGADARQTTSYTITGNLLVAMIAPLYITLINSDAEVSLATSFTLIFIKIATVIALPFFLILFLQKFFQQVNEKVARYKNLSFYFWSFALFVTIGQTADFVVTRWQGDFDNVFRLGLVSLIICIFQFAAGKFLGRIHGDTVAGGQLMAQKNSAMGIWIVNTFLNPVASVAMAFYAIWQNIFNSWQIYRHNSR